MQARQVSHQHVGPTFGPLPESVEFNGLFGVYSGTVNQECQHSMSGFQVAD